MESPGEVLELFCKQESGKPVNGSVVALFDAECCVVLSASLTLPSSK